MIVHIQNIFRGKEKLLVPLWYAPKIEAKKLILFLEDIKLFSVLEWLRLKSIWPARN